MTIRLVSILNIFDSALQFTLQGMDFDIYQIPHMESKPMNRHNFEELQQENHMNDLILPQKYIRRNAYCISISIAKSCG